MEARDIISNLPTNIRDAILTCLPLKEAVRASILSRKWKYCWINLSNLVFDDTMLDVSTNDDALLLDQKYVKIINQILLLHKGPILKFSFSVYLLEKTPEIDHIISFLSMSSVEEFVLRIWTGNYKLPSSFFSCRELTHLDLYSCIFNPPSEFKGFPRLISLKFVNVSLLSDLSGNFISKCPLLETLTLINVNGSKSFELSAPKLEYLCLKGSCPPLCIKNVPCLQSASIQPSPRKVRLVYLFGRMPALSKLVTNHIFVKKLGAGGVPRKLPTSTSLKILHLKMTSRFNLDRLLSLYCLISSSPSIQRIEIKMPLVVIIDPVKTTDFAKARGYAAEIILDKLQEVCLTYFSGTTLELEFIKLLLARSPMLEKILIKMHPRKDADSRLKFLKELVRFKRASTAAEIIFV